MEIEDGCLGDGYKRSDYLLMESDLSSLPRLFMKNNTRFYYNQANQDWSKKSCTIFGAGGAIADTTDYNIPLEMFKEGDEESYNKGRVKDKGWYVSSAVDLWRKMWNSNKKLVAEYGKLASYAIEMKDDKTVATAIGMLYNVVTGFYGNASWTLDYSKDGVLNGTDFGASTFGHCINVIAKENNPFVKDNYDGRKYNEYELANMPSKIKNRHNMGFVFTLVAEDNYDRIQAILKMKSIVNNILLEDSELWNLTQSEAKRNLVHTYSDELRKRQTEIDKELEKLK